MKANEAIEYVEEHFPIEGYIQLGKGSFGQVARTVQRYLKPGDAILDFASGPCDKTAVVQLMGYQCSAYDDLNDHWHTVDGNREKIMAFADQLGIDFRLAQDRQLPFAPNRSIWSWLIMSSSTFMNRHASSSMIS